MGRSILYRVPANNPLRAVFNTEITRNNYNRIVLWASYSHTVILVNEDVGRASLILTRLKSVMLKEEPKLSLVH